MGQEDQKGHAGCKFRPQRSGATPPQPGCGAGVSNNQCCRTRKFRIACRQTGQGKCRRTVPLAGSASGKPIPARNCSMRVVNPARRDEDVQVTTMVDCGMRAGVRCGPLAPLKQFSAPRIHQQPGRLACRRTVPHTRSALGKPMSGKNCSMKSGPRHWVVIPEPDKPQWPPAFTPPTC